MSCTFGRRHSANILDREAHGLLWSVWLLWCLCCGGAGCCLVGLGLLCSVPSAVFACLLITGSWYARAVAVRLALFIVFHA